MLEEKFQHDLQRGERILWTGRPRHGFSLHRELFLYWLIGAAFIVVGFFIEYYASDATPFWRESFHDWSAGDLRFAVDLVLGLWLMLAPAIIEMVRKPSIFYAVTNQRVILLFEYGQRQIRSFIPEAMPKLEMELESDGRGTLRFGDAKKATSLPHAPMRLFPLWPIVWSILLVVQMRYSLFDKRGIPGFADIPDAKRVYELISNLRGPD